VIICWFYVKKCIGLLEHDRIKILAVCRPSGCTVASGVVVVVIVIVIGICNRSKMRTSKCTCLIFDASIGLDPG